MGRLISSDPVTKKAKEFHKGQDEGSEYWIEEKQDVGGIIDLNKAEYASYRKATDAHAEMGDHYARIPSVVWGDLLRKGIAQDEKRLRKWLDDRDNLVFRRRPGSLSK
jgi:hypothetical protein